MIDHTSFSVSNYQKSKIFYDMTLATVGYECLMEFDTPTERVAGYGIAGKPYFWIGHARVEHGDRPDDLIGRAKGHHVAFLAPTVEAVRAWYEACLSYGGTDNGKPGPRSEYHPGYYGAFIIDPDGWRIEACLHTYTPDTK